MSDPYAPTALPVVRSLRDYRDDARTSAAADGTGEMQVLWEVPNTDLWLIDRIVVSTSSTSLTQAAVYVGLDPTVRTLRDGTDAGNFDIADYAAGLQVAGSLTLLIVWSGASAGSRGTAAIQYRVFSQGA